MNISAIRDLGVEVTDCNIAEFGDSDYSRIRDLYRQHELVVIRQPSTDLLSFAKVCASIGKICNEPFDPFTYQGPTESIPVQRVTGMYKEGKPYGIFGKGKLDWHCNMNGPTRAQCVALHAIEGVESSITSWNSTTAAYRNMSASFKERIANLVGHYQYSPESWAPGMEEFQREGMNAVALMDGPYQMKLVQTAPSGERGLYFHFLNSATFPDDPEVFNVLIETLFREEYVYHHHWQPGDVVISNQLVSLHKRQTDEVSRRLLHRYTTNHSRL